MSEQEGKAGVYSARGEDMIVFEHENVGRGKRGQFVDE